MISDRLKSRKKCQISAHAHFAKLLSQYDNDKDNESPGATLTDATANYIVSPVIDVSSSCIMKLSHSGAHAMLTGKVGRAL